MVWENKFKREGKMNSKNLKVLAIVFYSVIIALALGLPNMAFAQQSGDFKYTFSSQADELTPTTTITTTTTTTPLEPPTTTITTTTTTTPLELPMANALYYDCDCIIYNSDFGETVESKAQIGFWINFFFTPSYIDVEQYAGGIVGTTSVKIGPFFKMTRFDLGVSITGTAGPFRLHAEGRFLDFSIVCDGNRVWQ